ncbi:hypothetical protein F5Y19DRAFT_337123 [Xylariaceae sp. FL1651]|nr:hypothetical protein F5Y19DRAFT_337123 [Xylariaceae sp. FL1651]
MAFLTLPQTPPSPTQSEYESAIQLFHRIRDDNTLHEDKDIGGRPFILIDTVTSALRNRNNGDHAEHGLISRLLNAAYRRFHYKQPQQKSDQILDSLPIFYTLLDLDYGHKIHKFIEEQITKLPVALQKLKELFPKRKYEDLAERFYNQQWQWCAMKFEWGMSRRVHYHEQIVPITARTKIEPARDGLPKIDRKASLWVVEVPKNFVDEKLAQKLEQKLDLPDDQDNPEKDKLPAGKAELHYLFVVKRFGEKRKEEFEREKDIFNTIDENEGIIQYIGWYSQCEKDPNSGAESKYYNLVLERGDQDLYSAFQKENPPITFLEIQIFWQSMFNVADALASIQILNSDPFYTTYVWHGDIKPENILDVRGRFKLADPGEAQVLKVPKGVKAQIPKKSVPGGTRSFAAPEKFTYRPDRLIEPEVTQGSDIWSLGCVFSVAATYVVLGKEGVKQYRLLRQSAIESQGSVGDPFHDKEKVLPAVTGWHQYLKASIRKNDCYTSKVLDIVDSQMLITPGEHRISGAKLSQELDRIDKEAAGSTEVFPEYIASFIDQVAQASKGGNSELEDVPWTISRSGTELFSEELLYRFRRSEGRPIARQSLPGHDDAFRGIGSGLDPGPSTTIPARVSGFFTPSQRGLPSLARLSTSRPAHETLLKSPEDPPITFWEVEADLEKYAVKGLFKRRESVYGNKLGGKEDQLEHHFKNRDLVYLVDNASTMKSFWRHAAYLLKVLVWRSWGYDDNGMELRFTNEFDEKWRLRPKKKQEKGQFKSKMDDADPNKFKNKIAKTDMSASLSLILEDHLRKNSDGTKLQRHLTILVLTDGLWERNGEYDVDDYLITFIKRIPEENWQPETPQRASVIGDKPVSRPRPISIQFIRFGHHPSAILRLDRLDNNLKDRPELTGTRIPDVIDTESADGDVYKMFLGSFIEDFDNKAIQGAAVVSSTSGRSVISPIKANGTDISVASLAEHDMAQLPSQADQTPLSAGAYSYRDGFRYSGASGRPHFLWPSPSQTYPPPRVSRSSGEPSSAGEWGHVPPAAHNRHGSGESADSSEDGAAFNQYTRPHRDSQGQQTTVSSSRSKAQPFDPFNG